MGVKRNAYRIFDRSRPLGSPRLGREDNIEMDF
jgi:hypothetical protein